MDTSDFFIYIEKNKHFKRIYGQIRGQNWYDFIWDTINHHPNREENEKWQDTEKISERE